MSGSSSISAASNGVLSAPHVSGMNAAPGVFSSDASPRGGSRKTRRSARRKSRRRRTGKRRRRPIY